MNQISCRLPSSVPLRTSSYKEVKSNQHEILGAGDTLGMLELWRGRPITLSPTKIAQISGKQSLSVSARCSLKHGRWSSLNFFSWDTFWSLLLREDKIKSQEEIRRDKIDLKTLTQRANHKTPSLSRRFKANKNQGFQGQVLSLGMNAM